MQSPLPKTGMASVARRCARPDPNRRSRCSSAPRCGRARRSPRRPRPAPSSPASARSGRRRSSRRASSPSPESSPPSTIAAITLAACAGSRIRLQPALCFAIFGTGQPMFTSTMSAPMPSTICAAAAIFSGSPPKIWMEIGPLFFGVLGVFERPIDAADEAFGAHHLGDHEAAAAVALDQPAERRVGHAGHRGDGQRRREVDSADLHVPSRIAGTPGRTAPRVTAR